MSRGHRGTGALMTRRAFAAAAGTALAAALASCVGVDGAEEGAASGAMGSEGQEDAEAGDDAGTEDAGGEDAAGSGVLPEGFHIEEGLEEGAVDEEGAAAVIARVDALLEEAKGRDELREFAARTFAAAFEEDLGEDPEGLGIDPYVYADAALDGFTWDWSRAEGHFRADEVFPGYLSGIEASTPDTAYRNIVYKIEVAQEYGWDVVEEYTEKCGSDIGLITTANDPYGLDVALTYSDGEFGVDEPDLWDVVLGRFTPTGGDPAEDFPEAYEEAYGQLCG